MNAKYRELKGEYDSVGEQIVELDKKRSLLRDLMEEACSHEDLLMLGADPYLVSIGVEGGETKYKCQDCYRYFTKEEAKSIEMMWEKFREQNIDAEKVERRIECVCGHGCLLKDDDTYHCLHCDRDTSGKNFDFN